MSAAVAWDCPLTKSEIEVMQLLADGHTNKSAAKQLWVSLETVKSRVRSALKKLGVQNRTHAVAVLWRQHIIT